MKRMLQRVVGTMVLLWGGVGLAQTMVAIMPENQPTDTAPAEQMKLYGTLNRRLAEELNGPDQACVQSYAVYQACQGGDSPSPCGPAPVCSTTVKLPVMEMMGLQLVFPAEGGPASMKPAAPIKPVVRPAAPASGSPAGPPPIVPKPSLAYGPVRISSGVMAGLSTARVSPRYPPQAKAAHLNGTVVLRGLISKTGTIESLQVVSGSPVFDVAAIDAVRQWKYKSYLLNGEPTEVDTTITVNFTLGTPPMPGQENVRPPE